MINYQNNLQLYSLNLLKFSKLKDQFWSVLLVKDTAALLQLLIRFLLRQLCELMLNLQKQLELCQIPKTHLQVYIFNHVHKQF